MTALRPIHVSYDPVVMSVTVEPAPYRAPDLHEELVV